LTDALCFQGSHHKLREAFNVCSSHNWIVAPTVSYSFGSRVAYIPSRCPNNVQSCILKAFASARAVICTPLVQLVQTKMCVSFKHLIEQ